jgi:hypothetical protein
MAPPPPTAPKATINRSEAINLKNRRASNRALPYPKNMSPSSVWFFTADNTYKACSAFTRVTACTLALSPVRDTHSEGFSYLSPP